MLPGAVTCSNTTLVDKIPMSFSRSKSDTLDDIFGKPSRKDLFSGIDDDDGEDLFKPETTADDIDDITKYIEKNIGNTSNEEVDLFS